ncbi:MAG: DUF6597 domain-containing transcriptional factor, partial [Ferruginibacter sp.]
MKVETYYPSDILKDHIENYLVIKTKQAISSSIMPELSPVLSFRSKGTHAYWANNIEHNLPSCAITGLRDVIKPISLSKNTETILVKFKPCEAALFFKVPQHLFLNQSVSLYDFLPKEVVSNVAEHLIKASTDIQKVSVLENFLLSSFRNKRSYNLIKFA